MCGGCALVWLFLSCVGLCVRERAEIDALKATIAKMKVDESSRNSKHKTTVDRLQQRIKVLSRRTEELKEQVAYLEQERLEQWPDRDDESEGAGARRGHGSKHSEGGERGRTTAKKPRIGRRGGQATGRPHSNAGVGTTGGVAFGRRGGAPSGPQQRPPQPTTQRGRSRDGHGHGRGGRDRPTRRRSRSRSRPRRGSSGGESASNSLDSVGGLHPNQGSSAGSVSGEEGDARFTGGEEGLHLHGDHPVAGLDSFGVMRTTPSHDAPRASTYHPERYHDGAHPSTFPAAATAAAAAAAAAAPEAATRSQADASRPAPVASADPTAGSEVAAQTPSKGEGGTAKAMGSAGNVLASPVAGVSAVPGQGKEVLSQRQFGEGKVCGVWCCCGFPLCMFFFPVSVCLCACGVEAALTCRFLVWVQTETVYRDGTRVFTYRNNTTRELTPEGHIIVRFHNGDIRKTHTGTGVEVYYFAEAKTTHTSYTDGTQLYEFPNGQVERHYPDSSKQIRYPDGTVKDVLPSGEMRSVFPNGTWLAELPDGRKVRDWAASMFVFSFSCC